MAILPSNSPRERSASNSKIFGGALRFTKPLCVHRAGLFKSQDKMNCLSFYPILEYLQNRPLMHTSPPFISVYTTIADDVTSSSQLRVGSPQLEFWAQHDSTLLKDFQ